MNQQASPAWPRPSRMLIVLMAIIGALWVMFAVAMNWGGAPQGLFGLLVGDSGPRMTTIRQPLMKRHFHIL